MVEELLLVLADTEMQRNGATCVVHAGTPGGDKVGSSRHPGLGAELAALYDFSGGVGSVAPCGCNMGKMVFDKVCG